MFVQDSIEVLLQYELGENKGLLPISTKYYKTLSTYPPSKRKF